MIELYLFYTIMSLLALVLFLVLLFICYKLIAGSVKKILELEAKEDKEADKVEVHEDEEAPVPPVVPNPVLARQKASLELLIEMVKEIKGLRQDLKLLNAPKNNAERRNPLW